MGKKIKSIGFLFLVVSLSFCGEAEIGFNPPVGSTITIKVPDTMNTGGLDTNAVVQIIIEKDGIPLNNIGMKLFCTNCSFITVDNVAITDTPYLVRTGDTGLVTLYAHLKSPGSISATFYQAIISAFSGNASDTATITVN